MRSHFTIPTIDVMSESGSSSIEFATVTAIFLTMLIGILQISLALYAHHFVAEAARLACRYAIVRGNTCAVNGTSCTTTSAAIQTYVQGLGYPGINAANLTATTSYSAYPSGGSCTPSASCNNPGNLVTVTVGYTSPFSIPFMTTSNLQVSSTSAMIITQ